MRINDVLPQLLIEVVSFYESNGWHVVLGEYGLSASFINYKRMYTVRLRVRGQEISYYVTSADKFGYQRVYRSGVIGDLNHSDSIAINDVMFSKEELIELS